MRPLLPTIGLAALMLTSCASARRPDARLPAAFEGPTSPTVGPVLEESALDTWWTAFQDPELTDLIEQALVNSPDARTAAARLREARVTASSAFTAFLPQGDFSGSARQTQTHQIVTSGKSESASANLDVSWEVDLFGRIFAVAKAASGDRASARLNYEGARASLAANVADSYFQARGQAIQLEDARETVRIQRSLQDLANRKAERGLGATSDADRVAGDLAQAESQAASLDAQLQASRRSLLVLVGRGAEPSASLPLPASVGHIPSVPATAPGALLRRRPDVRAAEADIASAAGRLTYDKLAFLPTLNFKPGLGLSSTKQPGFSSTTRNWYIGAGLTQPILNIPTLLIDLKTQDARTEQAVIAYEKVVQTAYGEAENALTSLASDQTRVTLLTDGEVRARRAYDAAKIRYAAGLDDLQSALSAEQSWRTTRSQKADAEVQAERRAVQAYKALGGGWPAETMPTNKEAR
jgi:outer membrane protein, multidrug efflux system